MKFGWKRSILSLFFLGSNLLLIPYVLAGSRPDLVIFTGEITWLPLGSPIKEARFLGRSFWPVVYRKQYGLLLAAPLKTAPGVYPLILEGEKRHILKVEIRSREFPVEHLKLPEKMVKFPPSVLKRIQREIARIRRVLTRRGGVCRWEEPFVWPAEGRISSPFGLQRILNGEPRSPHSGVDLALPEGTPVKAAQKGRVVLVGDFYLPGKIVLLSHGCGVYTYYAHLSQILVTRGQKVKRGEIIGLSGASGRATGPHLHFGFYISGVKVDPKVALRVLGDRHGS